MEQDRRRVFVWTRVGARLIFINALFSFVVAFVVGTLSITGFVSLIAIILSYLLLFVLNRVRKDKNYFVPALADMSEFSYWGFGIIVLSLVRVIFSPDFTGPMTFLQTLDLIAASFSVIVLVMAFTQRSWTLQREELREKRIAYLLRKARLSKQEVALVQELLVEQVAKSQRRPLLWVVSSGIAYLVVGILINYYVKLIVDVFGLPGVDWGRLLS